MVTIPESTVTKPVEKTEKNILFWKKMMYFYPAFPTQGKGV